MADMLYSMMRSTAILLHVKALTELSRLRSELSISKSRTQSLEGQIREWEQIETSTKDASCSACGGMGQVRMQYAQDDIKLETCDRCKGSGGRPQESV